MYLCRYSTNDDSNVSVNVSVMQCGDIEKNKMSLITATWKLQAMWLMVSFSTLQLHIRVFHIS